MRNLHRAALADEQAWVRARLPKRCKLANSPPLRRAVARKLRLNWSPEQIAGWLKQEFPTHQDMQISHEAIKREHQRPAASVLPERNRLLAHLSELSERDFSCGSINVRERPWASKRQQIDYKRCCTDRLNAHRELRHSVQIVESEETFFMRETIPGLAKHGEGRRAARESFADSV